MLELLDLALEADRLAMQARNARCCDALEPCQRCQMLRQKVRARRLVVRCPRRLARPVTRVSAEPAAPWLAEQLAS